jgi:hypothetical protein
LEVTATIPRQVGQHIGDSARQRGPHIPFPRASFMLARHHRRRFGWCYTENPPLRRRNSAAGYMLKSVSSCSSPQAEYVQMWPRIGRSAPFPDHSVSMFLIIRRKSSKEGPYVPNPRANSKTKHAPRGEAPLGTSVTYWKYPLALPASEAARVAVMLRYHSAPNHKRN